IISCMLRTPVRCAFQWSLYTFLYLPFFPTRRSSDLSMIPLGSCTMKLNATTEMLPVTWPELSGLHPFAPAEQASGYDQLCGELRSEEHTSELQSREKLVCRLLLQKKKQHAKVQWKKV